MSKKKDENKWLQVGNFLLGVDTNAHGSYVVCKSVDGTWSVRWRDDHEMFAQMLQMMTATASDETGELKKYAHTVALQYNYMTTHFLTPDFLNAYIAFVDEYALKHNPAPVVTKEEEKAALDEVVEMQEIQDELEKLEKEG